MRKAEFKEVLTEFNVPYSLYGDMTYHGLHIGYYTERLQTNNTISIVGHFAFDGKGYLATNAAEMRDCLSKAVKIVKEWENKEKLVKMKEDFDD